MPISSQARVPLLRDVITSFSLFLQLPEAQTFCILKLTRCAALPKLT